MTWITPSFPIFDETFEYPSIAEAIFTDGDVEFINCEDPAPMMTIWRDDRGFIIELVEQGGWSQTPLAICKTEADARHMFILFQGIIKSRSDITKRFP